MAKSFITDDVEIIDLKSEHSWSGDSFGHSNIRFFYPKNMHVDRYKIFVITEQGEKKSVRSVMSIKRYHALVDLFLFNSKISKCRITYLKRSKIFLKVELITTLDKKKFTNRQLSEIQHLLSVVNSQI